MHTASAMVTHATDHATDSRNETTCGRRLSTPRSTASTASTTAVNPAYSHHESANGKSSCSDNLRPAVRVARIHMHRQIDSCEPIDSETGYSSSSRAWTG